MTTVMSLCYTFVETERLIDLEVMSAGGLGVSFGMPLVCWSLHMLATGTRPVEWENKCKKKKKGPQTLPNLAEFKEI